MLDFFQKYLCFGNGKQRSFSAQAFEVFTVVILPFVDHFTEKETNAETYM